MRLLCFLLMLALIPPPAQAGVLDDIAETKVLKVCIWPDYFGVSYRHPRTGTFQGIDIDLSAAFAKELGARLVYVETDFSRLMDDLDAHTCQVAMMGVGVTPQRAARVDFSAPYLRSDVYAIATKVNTSMRHWVDIDQDGRVVVVQKGTFMEPLMKDYLKHAALRVVDQSGERELEVKSGRADVFITDYPYSQRMLMNYDWVNVIGPTQPIKPTDYAYAVAKGDAEWLARVNSFVSQIKSDGRLVQAAKPYNLLPIVVRD